MGEAHALELKSLCIYAKCANLLKQVVMPKWLSKCGGQRGKD